MAKTQSQQTLEDLLGKDFAETLFKGHAQYQASAEMTQEIRADLAAQVKAVFSTDNGRQLLNTLARNIYARPIYPAPPGEKTGEYAARIQGQREVVALISNLLEE